MYCLMEANGKTIKNCSQLHLWIEFLGDYYTQTIQHEQEIPAHTWPHIQVATATLVGQLVGQSHPICHHFF